MNTQSWQDLPQQPRWSPQRLRQLFWRCLGWCLLLGLVASGLFLGLKKGPQQPFEELIFNTNGVIQEPWFTSHIELPWHQNLLTIDLESLQTQILQYSQIQSVTLTREYPSRLHIQLKERTPCAKLALQAGKKRTLGLVAPDGFIFTPIGHSRTQLQSLKTLVGIQPKFIHKQKILGFPSVHTLLTFFKTRAPDIWQHTARISLKNFDPFVEKKWQTIDLLIHHTWWLTFPLENPEFSLKKLQATLRALSPAQRQCLKRMDVSFAHPTVELRKH